MDAFVVPAASTGSALTDATLASSVLSDDRFDEPIELAQPPLQQQQPSGLARISLGFGRSVP
jgi:hypothetical protein